MEDGMIRNLVFVLLVIVMGFLSTEGQAASANSVQSGAATINSNGGTNTLTISISAIDTAKSYLIFQTRHDGNRPVSSMIRGRIASGTTLEFVRVSNESPPGVPVDIEWYVVEFSSGVRVQRGQRAQDSTIINVTLATPVAAVSQAFVTWSKTPAAADGNWSQDDPILGELTSTSNLQFRMGVATSSHTIWWQVVEYTNSADINVQKGSTSLLGGTDTSVDVPIGISVDVSKTFLLVGYATAGRLDVGANMVRAQLMDSSTIRIDRGISGNGPPEPDDLEIVWQAIELKDGSTVQRGSENFAPGAAQKVVGINTVDLNRTIAFGSVQSVGGQNMGCSSYAGDDVIGVGSATMDLSASQITMDRNSTADSADIGWFVVEFNTDALPIQLAYINANVIANSNGVHVTWQTITETNNYGFYVQQSVNSTTSFVDLPNSFVPGQGTTLIPQDYSWTHQSVSPGTYYYRLKQVDLDGTTHFTDAVQVIVDGVTGVDNKTVPEIFSLGQNYPNPFNPSTTIRFSVETRGHATLTVFNALGQEIATLFSGEAESGQVYTTKFDATDLANGMYFYKLVSNDQSSIKKLVLLK
jgi:hypothetical protein